MKKILNFWLLALLPTFTIAQNTSQNVDAACTQAFFSGTGGFPVGMSSGQAIPGFDNNNCIGANDIDVAANSSFAINKITFNLGQMNEQPGTVSGLTFDVYVFENNAGVPGLLVTQQLNIVPSSIQPALGMYNIEINLPTAIIVNNSTGALKKYWLGLGTDIVPNPDGVSVGTISYWNASPYVPNASSYPAMMRWNGVWEVWNGSGTSPQVEGLLLVEGDCNTLGITDYDRNSFKYYPNPVANFLKIESEGIVENISIYNLMGQLVEQHLTLVDGQIDMSSLQSGVYSIRALLQNNQIETFKVVKK
jgi:hypothetical protein